MADNEPEIEIVTINHSKNRHEVNIDNTDISKDDGEESTPTVFKSNWQVSFKKGVLKNQDRCYSISRKIISGWQTLCT